jgi:hypothetical protein
MHACPLASGRLRAYHKDCVLNFPALIQRFWFVYNEGIASPHGVRGL